MRISDWSSDVCSSDLLGGGYPPADRHPAFQQVEQRVVDAVDLGAKLGKRGGSVGHGRAIVSAPDEDQDTYRDPGRMARMTAGVAGAFERRAVTRSPCRMRRLRVRRFRMRRFPGAGCRSAVGPRRPPCRPPRSEEDTSEL